MKRLLVLALIAVISITSCSCSGTGSNNQEVNLDWSPATVTSELIFEESSSQNIKLSSFQATSLIQYINSIKVDYPYSYLYQLEEVKSRLDFDASVDNHKHSALDEEGKLTATHLADIVEANNEAYLADEPFGYENVDKDYILQITTLIVDVINHMQSQYPDIDWERVHCNLGNLKILYDVGTLSYAQVEQDLVLAISKTNTGILLTLKSENGLRNVLIHETMHIIQIGCTCENIDHGSRRCGICMYWDDFPLNTTDWGWLFEGSAERLMCRLTGDGATTYQYKMDYVCSFTLATLLSDGIQSDTIETLCFYDDPDLLFNAFGCTNQAQRDEVLNMMITMNILQMQPQRFYEAMKEATGTDPSETDESLNQFSYELKPAVCISLAKEFYENLAVFVRDNQVTANDICFLINMFESTMNQHLRYNNEETKEINQVFIDEYLKIRSKFFGALSNDNQGIDFEALYLQYEIDSLGEYTLNATLSALDNDKRDFLAQRAYWLYDLRGLGIKVTS